MFFIMEQQLELIFDSYQEGIERDFSTIFVHKHLNQKYTQCVFSAIAECGCRMAMSIFLGVVDFFGSYGRKNCVKKLFRFLFKKVR